MLSSAMAGAVTGASTMLGVVGVGLAASAGNREEVVRRQLHMEVIARMDSYERGENAKANRRNCCLSFCRWLLILGSLAEQPVRWAWHLAMTGFWMALSGIWWPLFVCNPTQAGGAARGWTYCMSQVAHHQVHFNLYLMAFTVLTTALCDSCCSTPWFFQRNLDLIRPSHPLVSKHLNDSCLPCCLPCFHILKEYEPVLDPQKAAAKYFRSMFFCLSGCESLHPVLVCGRCCQCCRPRNEGNLERVTRWAKERGEQRQANTTRFYQDVYQVASYEELEAQRVMAASAQAQREAAGGGQQEAAGRPSVMEVARTAVGLITAPNNNGLISNTVAALGYAASGGMIPTNQQQATAPPAGEEGQDLEMGRRRSSSGAANKTTTPATRAQLLAGGFVSLVSSAVTAGQDALAARRQQQAQAAAGGGGPVVMVEAVAVMIGEDSSIPLATVERVEGGQGSGGVSDSKPASSGANAGHKL